MGMNTKMIVTGGYDANRPSQSQTSGLVQALRILKGVKESTSSSWTKDMYATNWLLRLWKPTKKFDKEAKAEQEKRKAEQTAGQQLLHRQ